MKNFIRVILGLMVFVSLGVAGGNDAGTCENTAEQNPKMDLNQLWKDSGNDYANNYIELLNVSGGNLDVNNWELCYIDTAANGTPACIDLTEAYVNAGATSGDQVKTKYPNGVVPDRTFLVLTEAMYRTKDSNLQFAQVGGEFLLRIKSTSTIIHYLRYWNNNEQTEDKWYWSKTTIPQCTTNVEQNAANNNGLCAYPDGSFGNHINGVEDGSTCSDVNNCWLTAFNNNPCNTSRGVWNNNTPPTVQLSSITVDENSTTTIKNTHLNTIDDEQSASEISYVLLLIPTNGVLYKNGVALAINNTFTQQDINDAKITYIHDGSESPLSDSFKYTVNDGSLYTLETFMNITINPVNDAPTITPIELSLNQYSEVDIIYLNLPANDVEEYPAQLIYTLKSLANNGSVKLNDVNLSINATFTQDDINNKRVSFENNGSINISSFNFNLTDGVNIISSNLSIKINSLPKVIYNQLTINQNDRVTIQDLNLSVTDNEQSASQLTYSITSLPTKGNLILNGTIDITSSAQTFTQEDIDSGNLEYMHTYSNDDDDSFTFSVSDGHGSISGTMYISVNQDSSGLDTNYKDFELAYRTNLYGGIKLIGNTVLCEKDSNGNCVPSSTKANNDVFAKYVDIDGDSSTFNSSNADLELRPDAKVKFAILNWQGRTTNIKECVRTEQQCTKYKNGVCTKWKSVCVEERVNISKLKFKSPSSSSYTEIDALIGGGCNYNGNSYQCYKNITNLVQGSGTYTIADLFVDNDTKNYYGAWALTVVYEDLQDSFKNTSVFVGYKNIQDSNNYRRVDIDISGFLTPASGNVNSQLFIFAGEGDLPYKDDKFQLTDKNGDFQNVDSTNIDNVFDSSIRNSSLRNPTLSNNMGIDIDVFDVGNSIITNSQTSTTIRLETSGDQYYPGMVAFATELYSPKVCYLENVYKNGAIIDENTSVFLGDRLVFEVNVSNIGTEPAQKVQIEKSFDAPLAYNKAFGTYINNQQKTNGSGDDEVDYIDSLYTLKVRVGTGANANNGGQILVNQQDAYLYNSDIIAYPVNGEINNTYIVNYVSDTLKMNFNNIVPKCLDTGITHPTIFVSKFKIDTIVTPKSSDEVVRVGYANDVIFDINLTNMSNFNETNPKIAINFVNGFKFKSVTSSNSWTCSPTTNITDYLTCTLSGNINKDGNYSTLKVIVTSPNSDEDFNSVVVAKSELDTQTLGKGQPQRIIVKDIAVLDITTSTNPSTISIGDNFNYTISIKNNGNANAENLELNLTIDDVSMLGSLGDGNPHTLGDWSCTYANNSLNCSDGDLNSGNTKSLEIPLTAPNQSGDVGIDINVSANNAEKVDEKDTINIGGGTSTLDINSSFPKYVDLNKPFDYNVTIKNNSSAEAKNLEVNITISSDLDKFLDGFNYNFIADDGINWSCAKYNNTLNCKDGNLSANSERNVSIKLKAPDTSAEYNISLVGDASNSDPVSETNQTIKVGFADLKLVQIRLTDMNNTTSVVAPNELEIKDNIGKTIKFAIDFNNSGYSPAKNPKVTIPLDSNFTGFTNVSSGWSCDWNTPNSGIVECSYSGDLAIGEHNLSFEVITPTNSTPIINENIVIKSENVDENPNDNSKNFKINIDDMADLEISDFKVTATDHKNYTKTISSGFVVSDFEKEIIFSLNFKNNGPDIAKNTILTLNLESNFDISTLSISANSLGLDISDCDITSSQLVCKLADVEKMNITETLEFKFTTPYDFKNFNSSVFVSSDVKDYDSSDNNTQILTVKNPFSQRDDKNFEKNTTIIIEGESDFISGSFDQVSSGSFQTGNGIAYATFIYNGFIRDADTKAIRSIEKLTINSTNFNCNFSGNGDCNLSYSQVENANGGYDLNYQINVNVTTLANGSLSISNIPSVMEADKSYWSLFVVYKKDSLNYMNAIEINEGFKEVNSSKDTNINFNYGGLTTYDGNSTLYEFATDGNKTNTTFKNSLLNRIPSSSDYLGSKTTITNNSMTYKEVDNDYYLSLVALQTRVVVPLAYYANIIGNSKENEVKKYVSINDEVNIEIDILSDVSKDINITFDVASSFDIDIAKSKFLSNINPNQDFTYKLTTKSSFTTEEPVISNVKVDFTISTIYGDFQFENFEIIELVNDKLKFYNKNPLFSVWEDANKYNTQKSDTNLTTKVAPATLKHFIAPIDEHIFDSNLTYKLNISLIDFNGNVIKTPNDLNLENISLDEDVRNLDLTSKNLSINKAYRFLKYKIDWQIFDGATAIKDIDGNDVTGTDFSDPFAVRPEKFSLEIPDTIRAGENFTMDLKALTDITSTNNYDENETFPSSFKIDYNVENTTNKGIFNYANKGNLQFENGVKLVEANLSEVGAFDINITDGDGAYENNPTNCTACNVENCYTLDGCPFACIDITSDSCGGLDLITSANDDISVYPYDFNISSDFIYPFSEQNWTYMAELSENINIQFDFNVTAKNMQGVTVKNFDTDIFYRSVNIPLTFTAEGLSTNFIYNTILNSIANNDLSGDANSFTNIFVNDFIFNSGESNKTIIFNVKRDSTIPLNPVNLKIEQPINVTLNSDMVNAETTYNSLISTTPLTLIENNATFYYGRVWAGDYETTGSSQPVDIKAEVYCRGCNDFVPNLRGNENDIYVYWYLNTQDTFTEISNISNINTSSGISNTSPNISNGIFNITITKDGSSSIEKANFEISTTPQYLWFNSYGIPNEPQFSVTFREDASSPTGTGVNENVDPSAITKRRIDW